MPTSAWLRKLRPEAHDGIHLVCLPHAGGAATYYFPLAQSLSPEIAVLAIQYPGRQDRRSEPALDRISQLAEGVAAALSLYADRPLAFFGHSMGAVVAYETALRLQDQGFDIVHVFASGRRAPSRYRAESLHLTGDDAILRDLRLLGGTTAMALEDPELIAMVMPALRADYRAVETYRHVPGQRLQCPVTALIGDNDPRTSEEEGKAWADHTDGLFELKVLPGDHFYLNEQTATVAALVAERLI